MRFSIPFRRVCIGIGGLLLAVAVIREVFKATGIESNAPATRAQSGQHPVRHHSESTGTIGGGFEGQGDLINEIQWALQESHFSEARAENVLTNLFQMGRYSDALDAAQALERGLHRELIPTAVEAWAKVDGQAAWDAVAILPSRGAEMRLIVLRNWPDSQALLLGNLILGMPDGEERSVALDGFLRKLGHSDPAGLSEWLVAHPQDNAVMDQAAEFFVFTCDSENRTPEIAARWAARITSPERRARALKALASELDPPRVTSSGLLPESGPTD